MAGLVANGEPFQVAWQPVSPAHLDPVDVARFASERGQHVAPPHLIGEAVGTSRLTAAQVVEIRELVADHRSIRSVAWQFGIARSTVSRIVDRIRWGHVR